MRNQLVTFLLARAQERSSVLAAGSAITALLGLSIPDAQMQAVVMAVVAVAGAVAAFVPGGK